MLCQMVDYLLYVFKLSVTVSKKYTVLSSVSAVKIGIF